MGNLIFTEENHEYKIDEVVYPSVTQIITGAGLSEWNDLDMLPISLKEKVEIAGRFGTACHIATELHDKDILDINTVDEPIIPYLNAWKLFRKECNFTPDEIEYRGCIEKHKIPGTVDRIGKLFGIKSTIDIKTSNKFPISTGLQTAAYQEIYKANVSKKEWAKKRYGVLLKPNGKYELKEYDKISDWSVFLSAVSVYRWKVLNGLIN